MGPTPVSRLAVLARGEPAMRVVHAVRERVAQAPGGDVAATRVTVLHGPADRRCLVVREADEAIELAATDGPGGAPGAAELERALRACGADALWPGEGGLTPTLAEVAERLGVTVVGVSPTARDRLVAVAARRGPVETGGEAGLAAPDAEADRIAAEKDGRTLEVGVVADRYGTVHALGVREVLARHGGAVVLEESACPVLGPDGEEALRAEAVALVGEATRADAGPVGLVDVTFLLDPGTGRAVVRDAGPREPGTHPVTEMVSGIDAAELALHVGTGGALDDEPAPPRSFGHAIEARLCAEDPERAFTAAPGAVLHLGLPGGPGVRVDTGTAEGDTVAAAGTDTLVARIVAWGRDRDEARARLMWALQRTGVVVEDGTTTKGFLLDVLGRPEIVAGEAGTAWLSALSAPGYASPRRLDVALLAAAVEAHGDHSRRQQERLFRSAERGRPEVGHEVWHQVDLRVLGRSHRVRVARTRPARYRVELVGRTPAEHAGVDVDVELAGRHGRRLTVGGRSFAVLATSRGSEYDIEVDGTVHRVTGGERGLVRAPAPAMVVAVPVAVGDAVAEGDVVAVLESMKLETALRAPRAGHVSEVLVDPNVQVGGGTALVRVDTTEPGTEAGADAPRVDLAALAGDAGGPVSGTGALAALRALVLGFDVDERAVAPLLAALETARGTAGGEDADALLAGETDVLGIVADLSELSRNRRVAGTGDTEGGGHNPQEYLHAYLRSRDADAEVLPESFRVRLRRALAHYGVDDLAAAERDPEALDPALYRMFLAHRRASATHEPVATALLRARLARPDSVRGRPRGAYRRTLGRLVAATQVRYPVLGDIARQTRYRCFDAPLIARVRSLRQSRVRAEIDQLSADPATRAAQIDRIVAAGEPILDVFTHRHHAVMLEVMTRRYYGFVHDLRDVSVATHDGRPLLTATYTANGRDHLVVATVADRSADGASTVSADLHRLLARLPEGSDVLIDLYVTSQPRADRAEAARRADQDARAERIRAKIGAVPPAVARVSVGVRRGDASDIATTWFTFRPGAAGGTFAEDRVLRGLHPEAADRLGLWRLVRFDLTRLPAPADVHLFHARGREVPDDERLVVLADVRDLGIVRDVAGHIVALPQLEHVLDACLDALRSARANDPALAKLAWNRVMLHVWSQIDVPLGEFDHVARALAPRTDALGLEQVVVRFRTGPGSGGPGDWVLRMSRPPGAGLTLRITEPPAHPMGELDAYTQKVIKAQRRGALYPYELVELITRSPDPGGEPGRFTEYDLSNPDPLDDPAGEPVPVERPPGSNTANIVLGVVTTPTRRYPEGVRRVVLLGDPTRALGAIAEPECRRVLAALDLARRYGAPVEWYAVSAGAKIAMDSGTENMDWISRVLRGLITFTQDGGEVNVVVTGINVGAQPYWNAEATMLMHTRGILVMTPDSTMVLTGKQSLDYSGGVSAEDNHGIGGYDRIMGPNGQAQYWAPDLSGAVDVLLAHYEHTYTAPGERFPRPAPTTDPDDRDVSRAPHSGAGTDFATLGEIFDPARNGERKKPFDIRSLLRGVADADHPSPERWADMAAADSVVVLDAHLGGAPVELIGIESRPLPRRGPTPVDGPAQWTAGTLFPRSSKKTARAINAASGNRPVVVLANLTGFDGSPESLRGLQLEYGAEIGRAVVNFDGPIVFCVVSRYHGGAFVVFSGTLNDNMEIAAVEGSYASVIGGAPAAAVVFAGDVTKRTAADPRIAEAEARIAEAAEAGRDAGELRSRLAALRPVVRSEKLGEVADEFDTRHSVERARRMGSVHAIVQAHRLRPYLVDAVRRGMARTLDAGAEAPRTP